MDAGPQHLEFFLNLVSEGENRMSIEEGDTCSVSQRINDFHVDEMRTTVKDRNL